MARPAAALERGIARVLPRAEAALLGNGDQHAGTAEVQVLLPEHKLFDEMSGLHWGRPCGRRRPGSVARWIGHRRVADYLADDQTTNTFENESVTAADVDEFFAAFAAAAGAGGRVMLAVFILVVAAPTQLSFWAARSGPSRTRASTSYGGGSRMKTPQARLHWCEAAQCPDGFFIVSLFLLATDSESVVV
jgi:hypothetical protein